MPIDKSFLVLFFKKELLASNLRAAERLDLARRAGRKLSELRGRADRAAEEFAAAVGAGAG